MRHLNAHRRLGRVTAHRLAMLRNLVTSLLEHERITTTDAKAKEVRPLAERVITYGKRGDLHARRMALRTVRSAAVVSRVFDTVAKRYAGRPGGYTRIIKLGRRAGDGAPLSIIELLPEPGAEKGAKAVGRKEKKASAKGKEVAKARRGKKAEGARPEKAPRGGKRRAPAAEKVPTKGPAGRKGTAAHKGSTKGGDK
jgi:large subunit ribosomal protein L17